MGLRNTLLLLLFCCLGCIKPKEPEFKKLEKFEIRKIDFKDVVVALKLTFYNPNTFGVTLKNAIVDVYLDSTYLGKFTQDSIVAVKKLSDFSIPLIGSISLKTVLNLKMDHMEDHDVLLKANGTARVGKAGIFITKAIHYEEKRKLDFKL